MTMPVKPPVLLTAACLSVALLAPSRPASAESASAGEDWNGYNGTWEGTRFSRLHQVTTSNVSGLRRACTFDTGEKVGFQAAPVAVGGVVYVTTDTATYALDGATCALRWKHSRPYEPRTFLRNNRGAAHLDGRIFRVAGDVHAYAIDAATGRTVWDVPFGERKGETAPMAPVAWEGLVFVANGGGDVFGVTGRVLALDARDGRTVWRFDVVPSSGPARDTWTRASAENPPTGGGVWTSLTLDAVRGVLYVPTGNPAPDFVLELRPGESLYTNAVVALDARTGELLGYVQPVRRDFHDWDVAAPPALVETRGGRRVLALAAKDGNLYGIDPSGVERWTDSRPGGSRAAPAGKDGAAGRGALVVRYTTAITTRENTEARLTSIGRTRFCPGTQGGAEWNGPAFDPKRNLLVVNAIDWCTSVKLQPPGRWRPGPKSVWTGSASLLRPFGKMDPKSRWGGWVTAVDADTGAVRWKHRGEAPFLSGVVATAGGVVFTGDVLGRVLALDAATGRVLWSDDTRNGIGGGIATYAAGGRQYVAVAAGMKSPIWPVPVRSSRLVVYALP